MPTSEFRHAIGLWRRTTSLERRFLHAITSGPFRRRASSPPSRSPRCCRTSTPSPWACGSEPGRDRPGIDLHQRLVSSPCAGQGHQRPRRRRLRRDHLPRRQPKVVVETAEDAGVSCGHNASGVALAPRASSPAPKIRWATIYRNWPDCSRRGRNCRISSAAATTRTMSRTPPSARTSEAARRRRPPRSPI